MINGFAKVNLNKRELKRGFIFGIITSLVLSAVMGIIVLLQGTFQDIDWQILGTTLTIGVFSITSLSSLGLLESPKRNLRSFSLLTIFLSVMALALTVLLIWQNWDNDLEVLSQTAVVFTVLAISTAHASLLLALRNRGGSLSLLITATLSFVALVAAMIIYLVLASDIDVGDFFYRLLGVFAILDVLGTIILPIVSKFVIKETPEAPIAPELIIPEKP